eukprot:2595197-Pyramimonas_sp.AAC.1
MARGPQTVAVSATCEVCASTPKPEAIPAAKRMPNSRPAPAAPCVPPPPQPLAPPLLAATPAPAPA